MKKIIGYKITINKHSIFRYLKIKHGINNPDQPLKTLVDDEITRFSQNIVPSTLFVTYGRQSIPGVLKTMFEQQPVSIPAVETVAVSEHSRGQVPVRDEVQLALWNDCVAVSLCAVTIAHIPVPNSRINEAVRDALINAALEEAVNFVSNLIKYEAIKEDCETGTRRNLDDAGIIRALQGEFDFSRINISIAPDGTVLPPVTRFLLINWIPKKT